MYRRADGDENEDVITVESIRGSTPTSLGRNSRTGGMNTWWAGVLCVGSVTETGSDYEMTNINPRQPRGRRLES